MTASPRDGAATWVAFSVCCLIWSSTFLAIRFGNDTLPPVGGAALRLVLASLLLGAIAVAMRARWPRGRELAATLAFGVIDFGVSLPLLYWGETRVPSGVAAVMFATIPLSTSLFARAFRLEPLRARTIAASLLALVGVAVLASAQLAGRVPPWALVAVLLAAITAALAGVVLKLAPESHPFPGMAIAHAAGGAICLAVSRALGEPSAWPATAGGWLPLAYLVVFGSIVAFVTFFWLVQRWPVTRISFVSVVVPVLGVFLGVVIGGERLTTAALAGSAVVVAAVAVGLSGRSPAR